MNALRYRPVRFLIACLVLLASGAGYVELLLLAYSVHPLLSVALGLLPLIFPFLALVLFVCAAKRKNRAYARQGVTP